MDTPNESDTSHLQNTNAGSESLNGRPLLPVIPEVTQSAGADPLQREMEMIQKDMDEATKTHQDMQWRLNLECEKEIANIRKKYAALNQESKTGLVKQMEILESKYKIVYNSKLLAEAMGKKFNNFEVAISGATQEAPLLRNSMPNLTTFHPLPSIHEPPLTPFMPTQVAGNEDSSSGVCSSLFLSDLPDGINRAI